MIEPRTDEQREAARKAHAEQVEKANEFKRAKAAKQEEERKADRERRQGHVMARVARDFSNMTIRVKAARGRLDPVQFNDTIDTLIEQLESLKVAIEVPASEGTNEEG